MPYYYFFSIYLIVLFFVFPVDLANAEQKLPLINSNVEYQEIIPQGSGGVRVGVLAVTEENFTLDPVKLFVFLPSTKSSKLCVEIASQDGRYGAQMEYDISAQSPGQYLLEYPQKHIKKFAKYHSNNVAVIMKLSNQCKGKFISYAIAGWENTTLIKELRILLNPGATRTFLIAPTFSGRTTKFSCSQIKNEKNTQAFDTECFLPNSKNINLKGVKIKRYNFSKSLPLIRLPIELP